MKVLSLLQPWAELVVTGEKKLETRSWKAMHRGPILIHASGRALKADARDLIKHNRHFSNIIKNPSALTFGAIIGQCNLVDCVRTSGMDLIKLTDQEYNFGDFSPNRYYWILENPIKFKTPIPAKGALSIWDFDAELYPNIQINCQ